MFMLTQLALTGTTTNADSGFKLSCVYIFKENKKILETVMWRERIINVVILF